MSVERYQLSFQEPLDTVRAEVKRTSGERTIHEKGNLL